MLIVGHAVICQMLMLIDPQDMPSKFRFHVYTDKSLVTGKNGNESFLPCPCLCLWHLVVRHMSYPWVMLNNFCFHV